MTLYDRNFVMAMSAREVMGADVDEERMTWRKGWSIEGVSKVLMSAVALAQVHHVSEANSHLYSSSDHSSAGQRQT
jgi:hypothetical protein